MNDPLPYQTHCIFPPLESHSHLLSDFHSILNLPCAPLTIAIISLLPYPGLTMDVSIYWTFTYKDSYDNDSRGGEIPIVWTDSISIV